MAVAVDADMATADITAPFRFMDLPGELRNKVYALLLCSFRPAPASIQELSDKIGDGSFDSGPISAPQSNEPAILRVNSQVHREAYDVMIKTNRFVRITSPACMSFSKSVAGLVMPVVASGQLAEQFNEHLLDISLSSADLEFKNHARGSQSTTVVILGCQLQTFCRYFGQANTYIPGLAKTATLLITVAPMLAHKPPWYQDDLTDFFSEDVQMDLLGPLTRMRGIRNVEVHGSVTHHVATNVKELMMSNQWNDPHSLIGSMKANKECGATLYREGRLIEAISTWAGDMHEIDRMRESASWDKLIKIGGEPWIDQIAELQCSLGLNTALASIVFWGPESKNESIALSFRETDRDLILVSLEKSSRCAEPGHWKEGYTWVCPTVLRAKILYRHALCIRLWGEIREAINAMEYIRAAMSLVPDDPVIRKEAEAIVRWAAGM